MKKKFLQLLVITFLIISIAPAYSQEIANPVQESVGISSVRLDRYDTFLEKEIEEGRMPGAVSLVMRKGQIVHQAAFGYSSLKDKTPMRPDQIFYIQSMTKPIITVAFMMLYEEGHFLLTDPVSKYLPDFKDLKVAKDVEKGAKGETEPANKEVSIAHLLSHTAGFTHGLGDSQLDKDVLRALYYAPQENIASRVKSLASMPLVGHPGEQWYYSASPDVLALLIEYFSGMSTADFLKERLFDPLDMEDTAYNLADEKRDRMVQLHRFNEEGKLENAPFQTPMEGNTVFGGTHGLFSTALDYMKFCRMLLNGGAWNGQRFLSRKTIELMTVNHVDDLFQEPGRGFGLGFAVKIDLAESKAPGSVGQYFWNGAYRTHFLIDPQEELIAILMTQVAPYSDYYADKMRQLIYQTIVD